MSRTMVLVMGLMLAAANAPAIIAVDMYDAPLVQDAYVDSVLTGTTFDSDTLQARGFGTASFPGSGVNSVQQTFLMFDVSWLADKTIISAEFGVYLNDYSELYFPPSLRLWHVDDGWTETELTWNNSRTLATGRTAMTADPEQVDALDQYYVWDVWQMFNMADLADGFVSYMLTVEDETRDNYAYFNSGQSGAFIPYLHIEYIPEPATLTLLCLGGLAALRRSR
ncbi:MAG: DNRLRE domain-containing protein [Planctomycetaceae bacterium]|nr:DNRLRE domain-containing protein [Planctomycetaceae bacterium]